MILVCGATGTVGSALVQELLGRGAPVRVLVRDASRAPAGTDVAVGDLLDPESLEPALAGVDHAFLLTPFVLDQVTPQRNLIDAAVRSGGVHVVKMGAIGASLDSPLGLARQHAQGDAHLRASGLDWTLLHPHGFMQNLLASAATISGENVFYSCTGEGKVGWIDTRDIAAVAAVCLTEPGHAGAEYTLTGPEALSQGELAARLSQALGREIRYVDVPPTDFKQSLVGYGLPEPLADDLAILYGSIFAQGGGEVVTSAVPDVSGRPARTFEAFVADHLAAFQP